MVVFIMTEDDTLSPGTKDPHKKILIAISISLVSVITLIVVFFIFSSRGSYEDEIHETSSIESMVEVLDTSELSEIEIEILEKDPSLENLPTCGEETEFYTQLPLDKNDYFEQLPLGNLSPSAHVFPTDHIYLQTLDVEFTRENQVSRALYAPGDIVITSISESTNTTTGISDFGVRFRPCISVGGMFGHVGSLSTGIKNQLSDNNTCNEYETGGDLYRNCEYNVAIPLSAGDSIGTAGDGRSSSLDIWAWDYREVQNEFANPSRWGADSFHVICPADHYTTELKAYLLSRFTLLDGSVRTLEPVCGTIEVDIKGRAQGVWFNEAMIDGPREDNHVALVNDNIEPEKQAFSFGNSVNQIGIQTGTYFFDPQNIGTVNRDFSQVSNDGLIYCYEVKERFDMTVPFTILVTLSDAETIRIAKHSSTSCATSISSIGSFVEYVR